MLNTMWLPDVWFSQLLCLRLFGVSDLLRLLFQTCWVSDFLDLCLRLVVGPRRVVSSVLRHRLLHFISSSHTLELPAAQIQLWFLWFFSRLSFVMSDLLHLLLLLYFSRLFCSFCHFCALISSCCLWGEQEVSALPVVGTVAASHTLSKTKVKHNTLIFINGVLQRRRKEVKSFQEKSVSVEQNYFPQFCVFMLCWFVFLNYFPYKLYDLYRFYNKELCILLLKEDI